jgi:hypothetical protein
LGEQLVGKCKRVYRGLAQFGAPLIQDGLTAEDLASDSIDLIANKRQAGRSSDLEHLKYLQQGEE